MHAQQRLLCWQGEAICDLLLNRHLAKSIFLLFKINSCLPLVTASRATPQPEAPPPITKTSNSGVFFKALMWTDLEGRGLFGCPTTVFSAAITGDNKEFCNKKTAMLLTYSCACQHLHLMIICWKEGVGRVRNPHCCLANVKERDPSGVIYLSWWEGDHY